MKLERPTPVKPVDLGQWDIAFKPKPVPLGSSLLSAVWQHVCSSPQNTQDFIRDPFNVIGVVASNTSATIQERGSVIRAFETVLGIYHIEVNALGTLRLFSGRVPS